MFQLTVFRGSFFKILLQIQQEFFFLSTCKHRQAKCCLFLGICWCSCLILRKNVIFWNCHETRSHFETRPKTVNIQGYSELGGPIRRCENCCSLIFLNTDTNCFCFCCTGGGAEIRSISRRCKIYLSWIQQSTFYAHPAKSVVLRKRRSYGRARSLCRING